MLRHSRALAERQRLAIQRATFNSFLVGLVSGLLLVSIVSALAGGPR